MSTHTPGNWIVSYASESDGGCSIVSPTGTVAWHVSDNNATLIAAAPALLAALSDLARASQFAADSQHLNYFRDRAFRVVAQARGDET